MNAKTTIPEQAAENTDRELWREREGDYYADSIHVTADGGIGMNVGGTVIVMPIFEWHALATGATKVAPLMGVQRPEDVARKDYEDAAFRAIMNATDDKGKKLHWTPMYMRPFEMARHWARAVADAVLALPHTGQPQEGEANAVIRNYRVAVAQAIDILIRAEATETVVSAAPATPRAEGEWLPIETAPKDGREILVVFGQRPDLAISRWDDSAAREHRDGNGWLGEPGCWLNKVTHWRSLPAPPVIAEQRQSETKS